MLPSLLINKFHHGYRVINVNCHEYSHVFTPCVQTGEFNWDSSTQSVLIGAMFYGYIVTQLPGGLLAEVVGARFVFGLAGLVSGIITFVTPFIARWDLKALIASRVVLGLVQVRGRLLCEIRPNMPYVFSEFITHY